MYRKRIHDNPKEWLHLSRLTQWRQLSSIYYIGKSNAVRPKALLIQDRMYHAMPYGMNLGPQSESTDWPMAISAGAQRWMKWIGPARASWFLALSDKERLQTYQKLYRGINPDNPVLVPHALQFFAEPDGRSLECQKPWGTCQGCPLVHWCMARRLA